MTTFRILAAALVATALNAVPAVAASTVTIDYRYPNINDLFLDLGTNPVPSQVSIFGGNVILDISPTQIRVSNRPGCQPCTFLTGTFNGFSLSFSALDVLGTSIDASSTFTTFTADRITFNDNVLFLNFVDLRQSNPEFLLLNISTQPGGPGPGGSTIPEPASWAMLIAGFGLTGAALRRRRAVAAA